MAPPMHTGHEEDTGASCWSAQRHSALAVAPFSACLFRQHGLVHCDIKPGNICLRSPQPHQGCMDLAAAQWCLIDFGTSVQTGGGSTNSGAGASNGVSGSRAQGCDVSFDTEAISNSMIVPTQGLRPASLSNLSVAAAGAATHIAPLSPTLTPAQQPGYALYRSLPYCPPEVALDLPGGPTPAYDLWSVACVAYEAATGSKLFDVAASMAAARAHRRDAGSRATFGWDQGKRGRQTVAGGGDGLRLGAARGSVRSDVEQEEEEEGERHLMRLVVQTLGPAPPQVRDDARKWLTGNGSDQLSKVRRLCV